MAISSMEAMSAKPFEEGEVEVIILRPLFYHYSVEVDIHCWFEEWGRPGQQHHAEQGCRQEFK